MLALAGARVTHPEDVRLRGMMRPNATGWFIVAFFLIGGIAFWIALPWVGIGQIWVGVAVLIGIVYALMSRRADQMEALRTRGLPGQARILEMTQTGVYINENPQVKLKLHVEAAGIPPYDLEKKVTVPLIALGTLGSGRPLSVYVDPNDHENVFVDWSGAPAGAASGMASAPFTFAFPDGTSVDLTNDGSAQAEVLEVLRANGLDPSSGTLDLRSNPKARQAVLDERSEERRVGKEC